MQVVSMLYKIYRIGCKSEGQLGVNDDREMGYSGIGMEILYCGESFGPYPPHTHALSPSRLIDTNIVLTQKSYFRRIATAARSQWTSRKMDRAVCCCAVLTLYSKYCTSVTSRLSCTNGLFIEFSSVDPLNETYASRHIVWRLPFMLSKSTFYRNWFVSKKKINEFTHFPLKNAPKRKYKIVSQVFFRKIWIELDLVIMM